MPSAEFFDPGLSRTVRFEPLGVQPRQQLRPAAVERIDVIGAFGTCGDPRSPGYQFRRDTLLPEIAKYGLTALDIYNPQVEEWSLENALLEGIHFARDEVVTVTITNDEDSPISLVEGGMTMAGTMPRGQEGIIYVADDSLAPEGMQRARQLFRAALDRAISHYPLIQVAETVGTMSQRAAIALKERRRWAQSNLHANISYDVEPFRAPEGNEPAVYLSGSAGKNKPQWMHTVGSMLRSANVPYDDSYRSRWTNADIRRELDEKLYGPVQLIAITQETEALGALAEIGPRAALAGMTQQAIGIYMESRSGEPMNSRANRTRALALEHLTRLHEDFPNLPLFIAKTPQELATYGIAKFLERRPHTSA